MSSGNSSSAGDKSNGKSKSNTQKPEQEVASNDIVKEEPFVVKAVKLSKDKDIAAAKSAEVVEVKTEKKTELEGECFQMGFL